MSKKSKMGRPKLPRGEARKVFPVRLSDPERRAVEEAASKEGLRPSEWARRTMSAAALFKP